MNRDRSHKNYRLYGGLSVVMNDLVSHTATKDLFYLV